MCHCNCRLLYSAVKGEKPAPICLSAIFGKIYENLATTYKPFSPTLYNVKNIVMIIRMDNDIFSIVITVPDVPLDGPLEAKELLEAEVVTLEGVVRGEELELLRVRESQSCE